MTFQVTLAVIAAAAFSFVLVLAFSVYAVIGVDRIAVERQKTFVRSGLAEQVENLIREQQSVTVWDDAVLNAKAGNQDWMAENLGEWMHSYYGHDRVYVLDDRNRPVHVMKDGHTLPPAAFEEEAAAVMPLVLKLREQLDRTASNAGGSVAPAVAEDLALIGKTPAIVSVQPIVPSTDRVTQEAGAEYVDVSVQLIDAQLIGQIGQHFLIEGAVFSAADPQVPASVPLVDSAGMTLGYLTWQPVRPGYTLVKQAAPALIAASLLGVALLVFLLRRLRRTSQQLHNSENDAQYLAFHDTLTGLPNRALFEDRLSRALTAIRRGRGRMALLCVDLDRFKHVNDTLGHQAGDLLVKQAARRLQDAIRDIDTVARVGGDEFAIILVDIRDLRTAEEVSERILADLREPFELTGDQAFISASIGIAIAPEFGIEPEELLRKADIALYEAKRRGRGCYQVFAGDMDDILKHKLLIERELRQALEEEDGIDLAYQPVFAMDGRTIVGAEATLDWSRTGPGKLPGGQLVAIAAERGLIGALTEKMLRAAARFAGTTELPWIAMALSPAFLLRETAAQRVLSILAEAGVHPSRFQVEIGENLFADGGDAALAALATMREAGIRISLDDFGTGASSLTTLRRHPVDKLKIDRSFVRLLGSSDPAAAIVKAVAELAIALGMRVAAEGVETAEQKALLEALGCQEIQGALLSLPLPAAQLAVQTRAARFLPAIADKK
ncbi:bifunctional diguanylate cyclase/phosphodiesterase [Mesorhizobium sp. ASY16-5R]|uniref:bifunctional diguanylate cyclase/phosphodiesterase n=1 Tax=Mesorhizobium sp. ASY16-5R TaxID=3445772 RepID=UPI003F9FB49A